MRMIGLACTVPRNESPIDEAIGRFPERTVKKIIANTGVRSRRIAPKGMTASDLGFRAAEVLFEETGVSKNSVDGIVFISQTGDCLTPATSGLLQHRLGLPHSILSLDLNKGCTGFTDGLIVAEGLLAGLRMNRILLIVADTLSKMVDPNDLSTSLLFGDAASAILLERNNEPLQYVCGTDGSDLNALFQGGYRAWDESETSSVAFRSDALVLDGAKVFEFTIRRVPQAVLELMEKTGGCIEEVDAFVLHQANVFMMKYLAGKLNIPMEKLPISLERFGNTSGASIPMTMVTSMAERLHQPGKFVWVGFGVGLAWSAIAWPWRGDEIVSPLIEI